MRARRIAQGRPDLRADGLAAWNASPRDTEPQFSPRTGRLRRAVGNMFESLPLYAIAALILHVTAQETRLTAACALAWLAARILYIPAYALGWSPWRSVIFGIGALATLIMLIAALI